LKRQGENLEDSIFLRASFIAGSSNVRPDRWSFGVPTMVAELKRANQLSDPESKIDGREQMRKKAHGGVPWASTTLRSN
jgi:hypothetical protein